MGSRVLRWKQYQHKRRLLVQKQSRTCDMLIVKISSSVQAMYCCTICEAYFYNQL